MRPFPTLQTSRLVLREITTDDSEDIFEIFSCPDVVRYYDCDVYESLEQAKDQIQSWATNYSKDISIRWGVTESGSSKIIGTCGFNFWNKQYSSSPVGYDLSPKHWNKGIMTEALTEVLLFGFKEMKLNRIQAITFPENLASVRVLEKLGFQREEWGYFKGRYQDVYCYPLLKIEWKPNHASD